MQKLLVLSLFHSLFHPSFAHTYWVMFAHNFSLTLIGPVRLNPEGSCNECLIILIVVEILLCTATVVTPLVM